MVRLNFLTRKQNDANAEGSTCSGIIFHENYIMTAAHCCKGKFIVHVHFNDHSRSVEDKDEKKLTIFKSQERLIFIPKTSHSGFCPCRFLTLISLQIHLCIKSRNSRNSTYCILFEILRLTNPGLEYNQTY